MAISRKIGLHICGGYSGSLGKPAVVKIVDPSVQAIRDLRARVDKDCLIIVRWYEGAQPLVPPEDRAKDWFAKRLGFMRELKGDGNILYESYNEVPDSAAELYCRFEVTRMKLMQAEGFRSAVGSFSVGCPDIPTWKTYEPMLAQMKKGDVVSVHEYWIDTADITNPWHCARWQLVPQLKDVPIVVTECGRDRVENRGKPGWQHTCNEETFLLDLGLYGDILDRYPNVLGATVFQAGSLDPQWRAFDVTGIWDKVVSRYAAIPPSPQAPVSQPTLTGIPVDGRVMSVAQFKAHVSRINLSDLNFVIIHNTVGPTEADWAKWGGWPYWMKALKRFYESKTPPWDKGPHLFIGPEGICLFYPLTSPGRGVGGGDNERGVRHIEIVGNYADHLPQGAILENAVAATAILLRQAGLGTGRSLTTHDKYVGGWDCPGKKFRQEFEWFRGLVRERMAQE